MTRHKRLVTGLLAAGLILGAGSVMADVSPYASYPQPGGYGYMPGAYPAPPPMHMMAPPYGMPHGYHMPGRYNQKHQTQQKPQLTPESRQTTQEDSESASVVISQMQFNPSVVTVKQGTEVTWTQRDRIPHTVTASDNSFASPRLTANSEYRHVFDKPGNYTYYCSLHPSMRSEIRVVE